jgi:hypothetical protein
MAMTTKRKPEVDPKAAPCTDDELKVGMQSLRGVAAKPNKTKPKIKRTKAKAKPSSSQGIVITPAIVDPPDVEGNEGRDIDVKAELTAKELTFLRLHLLEGLDQISAMKSSGYRSTQDKYLQYVAKKILIKYESRTEDHRKIFRDIGAGEVAVAKGLLKLATTAKSEMVRLNAWATIAKCLGLTKEVVEGVEGIQIVINSSRGLAPQPQPGQHRPAKVNQDQPPALPAPLSITK